MTKTSTTLTFIFLISSWDSTADHHECLSADSVANSALDNRQLTTLNKRSFLGCLGICQDSTSCRSINCNQVTKVCELNARSRATYSQDFKVRPGWIYLDVPFRKPDPLCRTGGSNCRYGFCLAVHDSQYPIWQCWRPFGGEFCDGCQKNVKMALGMESGRYKDNQITSSSFIKNVGEPHNARLNSRKCWISSPNDTSPYLQVQLRSSPTSITRLDTQRDPNYLAWVTEYTLQYSMDGQLWTNYTTSDGSLKRFAANMDNKSTVEKPLNTTSFIASYIRIRPTKRHNYVALRIEIHGCELYLNNLQQSTPWMLLGIYLSFLLQIQFFSMCVCF